MTCKFSEDAEEHGGDHTEGPPPNTQCYHLKRPEVFERGGFKDKKEGGKSFNLFLIKEKIKSKISGAQVCFFFFQENFAEAMFLKVYIL